MFAFFFWCMAIWIFITVFADIFRRDDIGGGAKALWILLIVVVPFFGALVYLIVRPRVTRAGDPRGAIDLRVVEPGAGKFLGLADRLNPVRDTGMMEYLHGLTPFKARSTSTSEESEPDGAMLGER